MLRTVVFSLAACFILAGTPVAAELSVGVADMEIISQQSDANKAARNRYEAMFKNEAAQLDKQKADFDKKAGDFEAQRSKLDQKAFEQRVANLQKEAQQIAEKDIATQQRIGGIQEAVNQDMFELVVAAAADVAKAKKLDLILPLNSILFAGKNLDVTSDLLAAMNRIWKAQGSAVPGAKAEAASSSASKPKK